MSSGIDMISGSTGFLDRARDSMLDARTRSLGRIAAPSSVAPPPANRDILSLRGTVAPAPPADAQPAAPGTGASPAYGANLPASQVDGIRILRSPEGVAQLYDHASTPQEKKIKETADEFVSILYGMLFKQMDSTVERTGLLDGGKTEEMFRSMVLDEYAKTASTQNSNNPVAHRVYEMLYEASAARRPAAPGVAPAAPSAPVNVAA